MVDADQQGVRVSSSVEGLRRTGRFCASSPHHVTAIFKPYYGVDASSTGSVGVGLVVEPRVRVCAPGSLQVESVGISTVSRVLELLGYKASLDIVTPLPPGVGFAVSAASAIASSLAVGACLGFSYRRLLRVAHESEVLERTGLGDVLAISCGVGLAVRLKPGAPGVGDVDCTPLPPGVSILALVVGAQHTRELIRLYVERGLDVKAEAPISRIAESMSFSTFAEEVTKFNIENGLLRELLGDRGEHTVMKTPGIIAAYAKKGVAIVLVESDRVGDAISHLSNLKHKLLTLEQSRGSPEIWVP